MSARTKPVRRPPQDAEPLSKQRLRLWLRMLRTTRCVEAELREQLRLEFDTTLPRFDVMAALARKEAGEAGMTMTALSRHLLVSNGNVTGIVDRLVQDGLAVRTTSEADRRTTYVRLSDSGTRRFAVMAATHERWIDELLGDLDQADIDKLQALLACAAPATDAKET